MIIFVSKLRLYSSCEMLLQHVCLMQPNRFLMVIFLTTDLWMNAEQKCSWPNMTGLHTKGETVSILVIQSPLWKQKLIGRIQSEVSFYHDAFLSCKTWAWQRWPCVKFGTMIRECWQLIRGTLLLSLVAMIVMATKGGQHKDEFLFPFPFSVFCFAVHRFDSSPDSLIICGNVTWIKADSAGR